MIVNPFIEFEPIDILMEKWVVYDYLNKRKFKVNKAVLNTLVDYISDYNVISEKIKKKFIEQGLLIDENLESTNYFLTIKESWESYGWREAFKYHISTIDYKFEGNMNEANQKMRNYGENEPDFIREKKYKNNVEYQLPEFSKVIENNFTSEKKINKEILFNILTTCFGFDLETKPGWNGDKVLYRTTPSGGARQPTEGYIYIFDIEDIDNGWYYIDGRNLKLIKINAQNLNPKEVDKHFSLVRSNTTIKIQAVIILTTVFEKNMFRYREARTFRSVHMDVGNICAVIEMLCELNDIPHYIQYGLSEDFIEKKIGLNFYNEGYQSSISIGGRSKKDE